MNRYTLTIVLTISVLLGSSGVCWSADSKEVMINMDFQKGYDAYGKGDYATALKEWKPLAEQKYVDAQYHLGLMYYNGEGVQQDYTNAEKWWNLAAEQGDVNAQFNLGAMYAEGLGVPQDYKIAVKWYRLAAEQGFAPAQTSLGLMYATGNVVSQDDNIAHMWWNLSASAGNENALKNRDIIAKQMTPSQIEEAEKLARECVAKNYKGC